MTTFPTRLWWRIEDAWADLRLWAKRMCFLGQLSVGLAALGIVVLIAGDEDEDEP